MLFQTHHDRVFRTAHRITGSPADAEDVLQTVFLRLVKSPGAYDLSENPEAYLSRAAINASLDLMRSRTRAKSVGHRRRGCRGAGEQISKPGSRACRSRIARADSRRRLLAWEKPRRKCLSCVTTKVTTIRKSRRCWTLRKWWWAWCCIALAQD